MRGYYNSHPMLTLYQFPISHYCEKVRWALDHKKLTYRIENLLPGLHIRKITKLAKRSSVPVLVHDGKAVQNSADIITYLDQAFAEQPLTPEVPELKQQALEWERFLDEDIGIHLRRVIYHELLEHPAVVVPFFTDKGPWYGPLLMKLTFPKLRERMRAVMDINETTANESMEILSKRKANNALAQRGLMCSMLMVPGDSASMSSTVVAPGSFVNTSRKYA